MDSGACSLNGIVQSLQVSKPHVHTATRPFRHVSKGALLDWDPGTVRAIGERWSPRGVCGTTLRCRVLCDMCIILPGVSVIKSMDCVSMKGRTESATTLRYGVAFKWCSISIKRVPRKHKITFPTPSHHQQQPAPMTQGRMDSRSLHRILTQPTACQSRNILQSRRGFFTIFNGPGLVTTCQR